jgi:hypothetical protein
MGGSNAASTSDNRDSPRGDGGDLVAEHFNRDNSQREVPNGHMKALNLHTEIDSGSNPYRHLALAVIDRAKHDYKGVKSNEHLGKKNGAIRSELEVWITSKGPQSLEWWCQIAELCPVRTRKEILCRQIP